MLSKIELRHFEQQLLDLQSEVLGVAELVDDTSAVVELDPNSIGRLSRMDAMQNQAMAQAGSLRQEEQLRLIESAIERIDVGYYGRCLECDDWVAVARLHANPMTHHCIRCANELEQA